jgi:hypothetical protein
MIKTIFEITFLSWLAYCAWRVFSSPQNAIQVGAKVISKCPRNFAFQTYMKVREYYLKLSPSHKKYEMHGTNLLQDAVIDVWEQAGFQLVKHKYKIAEIVPNERMALVSDKSQVTVLGFIKGQSRSEVEFKFDAASENETVLGLTIRIVFPNKLKHLLARLVFTEAIWQTHAKEEMTALARLIEQRYAENVA